MPSYKKKKGKPNSSGNKDTPKNDSVSEFESDATNEIESPVLVEKIAESPDASSTERSKSPEKSFESRKLSELLEPRKRANSAAAGSLSPKRERALSTSTSRQLTLWDYLLLELGDNNYTLFHHDKVDHLLNILKTPLYLERVVFFGMLTCLDSFLYIFTILPLRVLYSFFKLVSFRSSTARKSDALKGLILIVVLYSMLQLDTSRIYHNIRGQAAIKLYVMFNVLEIADKLCSALGQDITECLFSVSTLTNPVRLVCFSVLVGGYFYSHCLILLYQIITLNVAVNSYSNALLTLLLSNQFSEIKGAVFKKFEREELFQLTCADITERFQLLIILLVIGVRNVVEVSNVGIIPASWAGWNRWLGALFGPALVVVGSEVVVDSMKHAYITKFNSLKPKIYTKFLDVLAMDYADNAFSDQIMTKRTGLPVYPLAIVAAKMLLQSYYMLIEQNQSVGEVIQPSPTSTINLVNSTKNSSLILDKIDTFLTKMGFWPALSVKSTKIIETPVVEIVTQNETGNGYFQFLYPLDIPFTVLSSLNTILICCTIFIVLLFIKLTLGVLLLRYSSSRYATVRRYRQNRTHKPRDDYSEIKPMGLLDEKIRRGLYEPEEETPGAKKPKYSSNSDGYSELLGVSRFKMASKRIW